MYWEPDKLGSLVPGRRQEDVQLLELAGTLTRKSGTGRQRNTRKEQEGGLTYKGSEKGKGGLHQGAASRKTAP